MAIITSNSVDGQIDHPSYSIRYLLLKAPYHGPSYEEIERVLPTIKALIITVSGPPIKAIKALAGKSPSGRTPMIKSVFRLMTRPRICGGTRVCASVITVAPTPFWEIPKRSSASSESQRIRLNANKRSAPVQSRKAIRSSTPLYLKSPSEAIASAPINVPRPEAENSRPN